MENKLKVTLDNAQSGGAKISVTKNNINIGFVHVGGWSIKHPNRDGIKIMDLIIESDDKIALKKQNKIK